MNKFFHAFSVDENLEPVDVSLRKENDIFDACSATDGKITFKPSELAYRIPCNSKNENIGPMGSSTVKSLTFLDDTIFIPVARAIHTGNFRMDCTHICGLRNRVARHDKSHYYDKCNNTHKVDLFNIGMKDLCENGKRDEPSTIEMYIHDNWADISALIRKNGITCYTSDSEDEADELMDYIISACDKQTDILDRIQYGNAGCAIRIFNKIGSRCDVLSDVQHEKPLVDVYCLMWYVKDRDNILYVHCDENGIIFNAILSVNGAVATINRDEHLLALTDASSTSSLFLNLCRIYINQLMSERARSYGRIWPAGVNMKIDNTMKRFHHNSPIKINLL